MINFAVLFGFSIVFLGVALSLLARRRKRETLTKYVPPKNDKDRVEP